ncbi:P-loop containing nucleoside triphosphate hydrolase protein [Biscogniauxia sp. FL1348]|nr:P-loop containing nucleoside triphosphate hydrolase protein [Biscogniauxia sp. FL1348]
MGQTCPANREKLPRIHPPSTKSRHERPNPDLFFIERVIEEIQTGKPTADILLYLDSHWGHDRDRLIKHINKEVEGIPAIFYVVESGEESLIRFWIRHGGNPNATCGLEGFPLLAFAILRDSRTSQQATTTIRTLLELGSLPKAIPLLHYLPFNKDLPVPRDDDSDEFPGSKGEFNKWYTLEVRRSLVSSLNLTQRYRLYCACTLGPLSIRTRSLVQRRNAEGILGLHQAIIGQLPAVIALRQCLLTQLAVPRPKPLVLLFAGPRGHGKMELARRLGDLTSMEVIREDCSISSRETQLFGPMPSCAGFEKGSRLNNFLAQMSGKRCVVYLDKIDNASVEVHDTLSVIFDEGKYVDRRDSREINCSHVIWILATCKLDDQIHKFYEENQEALCKLEDEFGQYHLLGQLRRALRFSCVPYLGGPLTARVQEIIPFLPFSPDEQAVMAHKGLMDLEERFAKPVLVSPNREGDNLVGNIRMRIIESPAVCSKIAHDSYSYELGARSIFSGVDEAVMVPLVTWYLERGDDDFDEGQEEERFVLEVGDKNQLCVFPDLGNCLVM